MCITTSISTFSSSVEDEDVEEKSDSMREESHAVAIDLQIARKQNSENEHSMVGKQGKGFLKCYWQVNPN